MKIIIWYVFKKNSRPMCFLTATVSLTFTKYFIKFLLISYFLIAIMHIKKVISKICGGGRALSHATNMGLLC